MAPSSLSLWIPAMALLTQLGCKAGTAIGEELPHKHEVDSAPPSPKGQTAQAEIPNASLRIQKEERNEIWSSAGGCSRTSKSKLLK
ncbi:hypothetical protein AVEN_156398-1, partial [Araneus ventricosus]